MSLAEELLDQAGILLRREPKHPKQTSLRRAVSTAYYALFNFLLDEAVKQFASDTSLRLLVRRSFAHTEMKKAATALASGGRLPPHIAAVFPGPIPVELRSVAGAFVELQSARRDADYNLLKTYARQQVSSWVEQVRTAFEDWRTVSNRTGDKAAVELFLTAMLLWDRWGKG